MPNPYPQFTLGGKKSLDNFGLYTERHWELTAPAVKTMFVDIPSRDGALDLSQALSGEARYQERTLTFPLYSDKGYHEFLKQYADVKNALHGKKMQIQLPTLSDYYLNGRVGVETYEWEGFGVIHFQVLCDPWLYALNPTVVTIGLEEALPGETSGTATFYPVYEGVLVNNGTRTVLPQVKNDYPIKLSYLNVQRQLSEGTWSFTDFLIRGHSNLAYEIGVDFDAIPIPNTPSAPELALEWVSKTALKLVWTRSLGMGGITKYIIYQNGAAVNEVAGTALAYEEAGLTVATTYSYYVAAYSGNGIMGDPSNTISVTTLPYTPPSTVLLSLTNATTSSLQISWTPSDSDEGISGYDLTMNGTLLQSFDSTVLTYTVSSLADDTSYTFSVTAHSNNGLSSTSVDYAFSTLDIPDPITNLNYENLTDVSVRLTWTRSTSPNLTETIINRNGSPVSIISGTSDFLYR